MPTAIGGRWAQQPDHSHREQGRGARPRRHVVDFDSGGHIAGAPLDAIDGAEPIATTLVRAFRHPRFEFAVRDINGEPGVIAHLGDRAIAVIALGVRDGRVDLIHAIGNPAKLQHLSQPSRS